LIFRFDGTSARAVAAYNNVPGFKELWADNPVLPNRATATGRAIVERRAIHIPDVLSDPEYNPPNGALKRAQKLGQYRTTLVVPMLREGVPLGTITLWKTKVEPYTDKQIELVTTFADQAVIAIENVRLFEAEQQRKRELTESLEQQTATAKVLQVISRSTFDLQTVLSTLVESAARLCLTDQAALFLRDGDVYRMATTYGYAGDAAKYADMPPLRLDRTSMTGRVALEGKAVHVHDVLADPEYRANEYQQAFGYRTNLGVPLLRDGTTIGVLALVRTEVNPFSEKQIELVTTFADQAVIAIENARLFNETKEALERQTATAEVLNVIASSPTSAQPVFDAIAHSAAELCEGTNSGVFRLQDGLVHLVGHHNLSSRQLELTTRAFPAPVGRGFMAGRAILDRAVAHVPDIAADPEYTADAVVKAGLRSAVSVPMLRNGEPIGAINVTREEARAFSDAQVELLKSFADQAVIAIENARLFEAEQERARELTESLEQQSATANVLEVISRSAFDLHAVFETVAESSVRLCDADRAFIMRFDGELLRMAVAYNVSQEFRDFVERNPFPPGRHSAAARVALERQTIHIPDVLADPEYTYGAKAFEQFRTVLGVPILKGEELLGVMIIYHVKDVRPFTEKQIALIETFADQAAIAIENARLFDALRQRTDELGQSVGELRALGEVSKVVNSTLELEAVLSTIVTNAVQLSGTEAGAIYVFNNTQREFRLRATYGMDRELIEGLTQRHIGLDEPNITPAFLAGEPIQVPDLREAVSSAVNDIVLRAGFRALLIAPLLRAEEIVGMLVVRRRAPGAFPQNTVELIKTFAAQSAVAIENARLFQSVQTSLEDLRATQDRLVQTQKLASLGQLTAGIAHEIKNPLNFVNNFSGVSVELIDELQQALESPQLDNKARAEIAELANTLRGNLDKIVQHGKRADAIVKNMLLHSREGSGEHRLVDANALVEDSLNLAYHGARAEKQGFKINIERSLDPAAGQVDVFPQEITRALLNLISNGFYAANKRKEQNDSEVYEPTLTASTKNLGDRVEVRIRDNGTGIPPEVKDKMFNPFFTTKPAGEGTGLGLSICHDIIVKQHAGSIEVDSQPDEFTEVRIVLPRAAVFQR
jgi:two-component system, NtrC family, sensor kinase